MKKFTKRIIIFLIILAAIIIGLIFITKQTSRTISSVCNDNGWKLTPQTDTNTGNQAYMCWKAENPLIVKDSWTWGCENGNEFVYYHASNDLTKFQTDWPDVFDFIKSNCKYLV